MFGARCWAKIPTAHGRSKLDPRSVECRLLGYASGNGNYRVQDIVSRRVFISRDVIFEEGQPRRTLAGVGEEVEQAEQVPLFDTNIVLTPPADTGSAPAISYVTDVPDHIPDQTNVDQINDQRIITSAETRKSSRTSQPSRVGLQSLEYGRRKIMEKEKGNDWATDHQHPQASFTIDRSLGEYKDLIICLLTETKASHNILDLTTMLWLPTRIDG